MPALRHLALRFGTTLLVVLGAVALLIALTTLVPGDPAATLLGPQASPETVARFRTEMGLDQPVPLRILRFAAAAAEGNLGTDVVSGRPVRASIAEVLPYTAALTTSTILLALLLGVPLGAWAAARPGSLADNALASAAVALIAIPSFVTAIALLLVFSTWLDWLPVLGAGDAGDWQDQARRTILPTLALSAGWIGYVARLVRTGMLEALSDPAIRTARAFGLPEHQVLYKYALKSACIPVLAVIGLGVGRLLGGAVLVEVVFARPGLGRLVIDAINARNFPVLQGAVLVVVAMYAVANLLVDLLYTAIDPRIVTR